MKYTLLHLLPVYFTFLTIGGESVGLGVNIFLLLTYDFIIIILPFQLFQLLSYIPPFQLMTETFNQAKSHLIYFMLIMALVFFSCTLAFFAAFGEKMFQYRNLTQTLYSLLRMCMGDFELTEMQKNQPGMKKSV